MTYPVSRFNVIAKALVSQLSAALDCTVSLSVPLTGEQFTDFVIVAGATGDETGEAGEFSQDYHDLAGNQSRRMEVGTIPVEVWAFDGDSKAVEATMDRAFATLAEIAEVLRSTIELDDEYSLEVQIASVQVALGPDTKGAFCQLRTQIQYRSLI